MARLRLDLRISGASKRNLRKWRRLTRRGTGPGILIVAIPFMIATIHEPSIEVGDRQVAGRRIQLIQDKSGSMTAQQAMVDQRLDALRAAGMFSEVACELSNNEFPDFVACVEKLAHRNDIDGLYVFADFEWEWNGSYTCSPQPGDGTRRVVDTLQRTGWRLYFETIKCGLPRDLAELAENSGGGVIHTGK